jgi:hypothetical protein
VAVAGALCRAAEGWPQQRAGVDECLLTDASQQIGLLNRRTRWSHTMASHQSRSLRQYGLVRDLLDKDLGGEGVGAKGEGVGEPI